MAIYSTKISSGRSLQAFRRDDEVAVGTGSSYEYSSREGRCQSYLACG